MLRNCIVLGILFAGLLAIEGDATGQRLTYSAPETADLDQYGGYKAVPVPGGATGRFRVAKLAGRWLLVTPDGNAFWMRAVYGIDTFDGGEPYKNRVIQKYGDATFGFASQALRRMKSWGFNAIGEYASAYALPVPTYFRPSGNPVQLPFIRMIRPAYYSLVYGNVKEVISATDPAIYTGWRGHFPDVFDPGFARYAQTLSLDNSASPMFTPALKNSPWLIGTTIDDRDDTYGFGEESLHSHLGWITAVTAPTQKQNSAFGATYKDTVVYTKQAFANFLQTKYGTIAALNAAWGSTYTTFGSDGGWPGGKGVLDESGRNSWMGKDFDHLSRVSPTVKADLDAWLEALADKYFSVVSSAARAYAPNGLVFSQAAIGGAARIQILRAASRHLDVLQLVGSTAEMRQAYNSTAKPIFVWTTFSAQRDSPFSSNPGSPGTEDGADLPTQGDRGAAYAANLAKLINLQGTDGSYPIVGIDWWSWTDKATGGERTNFGLVSNLDNAYDGRASTTAAGKDPWGFATGEEKNNYRDFLSAVTQANQNVSRLLRSGSASGDRHP